MQYLTLLSFYTKRSWNSICLIFLPQTPVNFSSTKKCVDSAFARKLLLQNRWNIPQISRTFTRTNVQLTTIQLHNREEFERCKINDNFLLHWSSLCSHTRRVYYQKARLPFLPIAWLKILPSRHDTSNVDESNSDLGTQAKSSVR